jgi:hypothetical protein
MQLTTNASTGPFARVSLGRGKVVSSSSMARRLTLYAGQEVASFEAGRRQASQHGQPNGSEKKP